MEPDSPSVTQYDDSGIRDNAGPVIINKIELPAESPWKQPAVYIAILALIVAGAGELWRFVAQDEAIAAVKTAQHDYYEEINVWETDSFNRSKDIDATLKARFGWDMDSMFGKLKPPPVPKEK